MKKSNEIKKHLAKGEVTSEMLGMATFSYNKRAKNMRDQEREWRDYFRHNRVSTPPTPYCDINYRYLFLRKK